MTNAQFWIIALIGVVQCILLALLVKREMSPTFSSSQVQPPNAHSQSHHIYGCQLINNEWQDVEELRSGMNDHTNHERVKWFLSNGPAYGIRWSDGHIELGSESTTPLVA